MKKALEPLQPRVNQLPNLNQPIAHRTKSKIKKSVQKPVEQPVAQRARSRTKVAGNDVVAAIVSDLLAAPVMDEETGEMLEFRQLRSHSKYKKIWDTSYANELGRLCQDAGTKKEDPTQQRVKGTATFRVIRFDDIPPCKAKRSVSHLGRV